MRKMGRGAREERRGVGEGGTTEKEKLSSFTDDLNDRVRSKMELRVQLVGSSLVSSNIEMASSNFFAKSEFRHELLHGH